MPKLTKRLIDSTPCPKDGQLFLRDSELPGFALRLTKGRKAFTLEKKIRCRFRRITIGPYGPLTLDQARDLARKMIVRVIEGEDPAEDRSRERGEPTFGELIDLYLERHAPKKKSAFKDRYHIDRFFHPWKTRRLRDISRKDVARLHAVIGKTAPYTANRVIDLLRKMFNLARVWGLFSGENPVYGIDRFPEKKRDRFVKEGEIKKLWDAIRKESDIRFQGIFATSLLTGARVGEVLRMQWKDLDFKRGIWKIEETKAGRSHYLPLPKLLIDSLSTFPISSDNPHVFFGHRGQGPLVNVARAWNRIRERSGLRDIRIHDLRRTLGSWLAGAGESLPMIGKILGHSQPSTTAIYARLDLDPLRSVLEANTARMIAIAGPRSLIKSTPGVKPGLKRRKS